MTVELWGAAAQLFVGCLSEGGLELRPFWGCVQAGAGLLVAVCLHENCKRVHLHDGAHLGVY